MTRGLRAPVLTQVLCADRETGHQRGRATEPDTFASQEEDGALKLPRDTARTLQILVPDRASFTLLDIMVFIYRLPGQNALQSRRPEELPHAPVIDKTSAFICLLFNTVTSGSSVLSPPPAASPTAGETVPLCHPQHK